MADANVPDPDAVAAGENAAEDDGIIRAIFKDTATRRAARTLLQFLAALILTGAFDALVNQTAADVPATAQPIILGGWVLVVAAVQNWAEDAGKISPILGTKADVKHTPA